MFGRYSGGDGSLGETSSQKETKCAKVVDTKAAPSTGYKRVIVRDRSAGQKISAIDIPNQEARHVEKKKTYNFEVEEKQETRYGGGGRTKKHGFRTYICEEAPELYDRKKNTGRKEFGKDRGSSSSRTKFSTR